MRLWSLHPKYLDSKGLVALWREGLLALKVLQGKTKGYKNHPQLIRFKESDRPVTMINAYLGVVLEDARRRGYCFDEKKISKQKISNQIAVTQGQLRYEITHLKKKLWQRDRKQHSQIKKITKIEPHKIFKIVPGTVEEWERV